MPAMTMMILTMKMTTTIRTFDISKSGPEYVDWSSYYLLFHTLAILPR